MKIYAILIFILVFTSLDAQWNKSSLQLKNQLKYKDAVAKYETNSQNYQRDFEFARTLYKIGEYKKSYFEYLKLHEHNDSFSALDIQYFLTATKIENHLLFDSFSNFYAKKIQYRQSIQENVLNSKDSFKLISYSFNHDNFEDFSPIRFKNNLIFVSSRFNPINRLDDYNYNRQPFYDLYIENNNEIINLNNFKSKDLPSEINTDLHDGPIYISEKFNMVFVTRNINYHEAKTLNLGIFYSQKINGKWSNFIPLPVNSDLYSVQHPFFDDSTQELYFSSNMNQNNFDLYKIKLSNGKWENPILLSNKVNTKLDEVFPYKYKSRLYFSSNGFSGKGGFDIISFFNDTTTLITKLNSIYDDYGILFINDTSGYISTNRFGGFGKDDILSFTVTNLNKRKVEPQILQTATIAKQVPKSDTLKAIKPIKQNPIKKAEIASSNPPKEKTKTPISEKPLAENNNNSIQNECGDLDHDGILDYKDLDSDNDGIYDKIEGQNDLDNDGIPNYLDTDSDNDNIPDETEGTKDSDKDKIPNYLDNDSDNDGIKDKIEGLIDTDSDGTHDYLDLDSDNDGIKDMNEGNRDTDRDGIFNYLDLDSDNDGISDQIEGSKDFDKDGIPNFMDLDSDGDGISDEIENGNKSMPHLADADGDGQPNYLDLDSDMDGIPDRLERPDCSK